MRKVRRFINSGDVVLTFHDTIFIGLPNCPKILDFSQDKQLKFCFDFDNEKLYQLMNPNKPDGDWDKVAKEAKIMLKYGQEMIEIDGDDFDELISFMDIMYIRSREEIRDPLTQSPVSPLLLEFIKKQVRNVKLKSLIN